VAHDLDKGRRDREELCIESPPLTLESDIHLITYPNNFSSHREVLMRLLTICLAMLCFTPLAHAGDAPVEAPVPAVIGTWKLVSFFTEDSQTKQRNNAYGEHPTGALSLTPAGRFLGIVTGENRKTGTIEEQAAAFRGMISYTGKWRLEGETFITKVDASWDPHYVGTDQVRFWRVQDGKLYITSAPVPNPNLAGSTMIGISIWEKE
jgi:hypothetical protein